jgi:hypothetical protein
MVLTASLSALRAVVWGKTLPASCPDPGWRGRFYALALGGLVQNGLPGHLGVLASAWVLARGGGPPLPAALASLLLAKLLEFGALVTTTACLALLARLRGVGGLMVGPMLWTGFGALALFVVAMAGARTLLPRLARRFHGRWPRLAVALEALTFGLTAIGSPRRLLVGWAFAFLPVLASASAFALALRHVGASSYLLGGGLVVGAVTLTQMVPGLPSSMGLYYFACAATARALGVADEPAAAVAALSHAASGITHVLVGVVSLLVHDGGLRDILRVRDAVRRMATRDAG